MLAITHPELQLLYILVLGRTCLVVLVAKHPIFFIASLFCYILLSIINYVCVKAKVKIMKKQFLKKFEEKKSF